tara:strand:+ start:42 stop:587 length:546 start_codon:yes stop_codon:yes gene_type:complete
MAIEYGDGSDSNEGRIIQVVRNNFVTRSSTSCSQHAFATVTAFNTNITPKSTNSRIIISVGCMGEPSDQDHHMSWSVYRSFANGTNAYINIHGDASGTSHTDCIATLLQGYYGNNSNSTPTYISLPTVVDHPSYTGQITYRLRMQTVSGSATWYTNRCVDDNSNSDNERGGSHMTLMEVAS